MPSSNIWVYHYSISHNSRTVGYGRETGYWRLWHSKARDSWSSGVASHTPWALQADWYWPPPRSFVVWTSRNWQNHACQGCCSSYNCCFHSCSWVRVCAKVSWRGQIPVTTVMLSHSSAISVIPMFWNRIFIC